MGAIRLPVTGDWVEGSMIHGVTAHGDLDFGGGMVTIWTSNKRDGREGLEPITWIYVSSLDRAQQVRDLIATVSGLADGADDSAFDPNDPDRLLMSGDDGDEEDDEEGDMVSEKDPEDDDGDGGGGQEIKSTSSEGPAKTNGSPKPTRFSQQMIFDMLTHWDCSNRQRN